MDGIGKRNEKHAESVTKKISKQLKKQNIIIVPGAPFLFVTCLCVYRHVSRVFVHTPSQPSYLYTVES